MTNESHDTFCIDLGEELRDIRYQREQKYNGWENRKNKIERYTICTIKNIII
jgi:hypothetical protein